MKVLRYTFMLLTLKEELIKRMKCGICALLRKAGLTRIEKRTPSSMLAKILPTWLTKAVSAFAVITLLAGCASMPSDENVGDVAIEDFNDPIEGVNRYVFEVNMGLDKLFLRPVAEIYDTIVPGLVKDAVRSFLNNLRTPVILFNDLMQGEFNRAWTTLARFGINSTGGGLGFYDLATDWGYPRHDEDFGQTLATWGVGEGPYLMLPLYGPSNPRDAVGRVVDFFLDPLNWYLPGREFAGIEGFGPMGVAAMNARTVANMIDGRSRHIEELDTIEASSLDFYAQVRSLYRQNRANEIANGRNETNFNGSVISEADASAN